MPGSVRFLCGTVLLTASVSLVGCGEKPTRLPLVPVKGSVTVGGRPPVGALVRFYPQDPAAAGGVNPSAHVRDDGTFEGGSYVKGDGVPPGEYTLTITWEEETGKPGEMADRLGGRYADPKKSQWRVRVGTQATDLEPFKIP